MGKITLSMAELLDRITDAETDAAAPTFEAIAARAESIDQKAKSAEDRARDASQEIAAAKAAADDAERVDHLKSAIYKGISDGIAPESLLYLAAECIALATHDPEYIDAMRTRLDVHTGGEHVQQALLYDRSERDAEKRAQLCAKALERTLKVIDQRMNQHQQIIEMLANTRDAITGKASS